MKKSKKHSTDPAFLTSAQAAAFLNVSLSTLKKYIHANKIKTLKTPGGHYRIRKSDLLELVQ
jgi:excisionase family DNA binding protein